MTQLRVSRRSFLASTAAVAATAIAPQGALAKKPKPAKAGTKSDQFRFAQVGCGGKGGSDLSGTLGAGGKLVAMCDVDSARAAKTFEKHADVPKFTDFRKMLDQVDKEIDAVVVSTPDHTHAAAALDAMRRGKHVYVQKPLARTFGECQALLEATRKHGVATQMGNQGHSGAGLVLWQKMMDAGAFGEIEQVHTWSNRPIWPQGMTELPQPGEVPDTLDWDSWIGPQNMRPYAKAYLPFNWRGWWDFGCGAMGDMACHNMDPAFWVLKLGLPTTIKAEADAPAGIAYPNWSIIEYTFPPTPVAPKGIKLTWYDGKKLPPNPANSHPELKLGDNGCLIVGSKMTAKGGSHASPPIPIALGQQEYGPAVKDVEREWREVQKTLSGVNHYGSWIEAATSGDSTKAGSQFEYAVPMTQAILLGCIALRFPGQELHWDNARRQFSNLPEANQWLTFKPRKGYDLSV
jgi:predicted dehydrogenase